MMRKFERSVTRGKAAGDTDNGQARWYKQTAASSLVCCVLHRKAWLEMSASQKKNKRSYSQGYERVCNGASLLKPHCECIDLTFFDMASLQNCTDTIHTWFCLIKFLL